MEHNNSEHKAVNTAPLRKLVIQPNDGIAPVLGVISGAKISLRIKQFTLTDPIIKDAIIAAHVRGVDIRVMLNLKRPDGGHDNDGTSEEFQKLGIKVQWANPAFIVTHEKSVVADDATALIATFNMAPKYFAETRDYGVITTDPVQVQQIMDCFDADWERDTYVPDHFAGLLWSVHNSRIIMAEFIDSAKKTLYVQHPKFVDVPILDRIIQAKARGVHVHFICSGKHGVQLWDRPETFASLRIMQKDDIKVKVLKAPKLHGKLIIKDEEAALLGSMNIHRRAFDERRELGIQLTEKDIVDKLIKQFHTDWESAEHYHIPDPMEKDFDSFKVEDVWI